MSDKVVVDLDRDADGLGGVAVFRRHRAHVFDALNKITAGRPRGKRRPQVGKSISISPRQYSDHLLA